MAPELEAGTSANQSADVWGLGQLAYQLLSPLPTHNCRERYIADNQPVYWVDYVSDDVKDLVMSMVSSDPKDRPKI